MVTYLKDGMVLDEEKIWKLAQDKKDHFKMGRDTTTNKLLLYQKIRNNKIL